MEESFVVRNRSRDTKVIVRNIQTYYSVESYPCLSDTRFRLSLLHDNFLVEELEFDEDLATWVIIEQFDKFERSPLIKEGRSSSLIDSSYSFANLLPFFFLFFFSFFLLINTTFFETYHDHIGYIRW